MGEIINFFLKFKSLIEIREFRLRFISTIILFTTLFLLFLIGNPFFVFFLTLLFSLLFYEFEKIDSTNVTKSQFFKLFVRAPANPKFTIRSTSCFISFLVAE